MPYLSPNWTLLEVACWLAFRKPPMVNAVSHEMLLASAERQDTSVKKALNLVADAVISGQLPILAKSVATGQQQRVSWEELADLELHVAEDIPGAPIGFRSRTDGVIRWVSPLSAAGDVLRYWPAFSPINHSSNSVPE